MFCTRLPVFSVQHARRQASVCLDMHALHVFMFSLLPGGCMPVTHVTGACPQLVYNMLAMPASACRCSNTWACMSPGMHAIWQAHPAKPGFLSWTSLPPQDSAVRCTVVETRLTALSLNSGPREALRYPGCLGGAARHRDLLFLWPHGGCGLKWSGATAPWSRPCDIQPPCLLPVLRHRAVWLSCMSRSGLDHLRG